MKALDLCCSAGGVSMGLHRAGFEVTGVDIKPQKRYPFKFIQADALEIDKLLDLSEFDLIWASPHCQAYSRTRHMHNNVYPDQVGDFRELLVRSGRPYIIENVPGSPLINPIKLTGADFGLKCYRERWFECSFFTLSPGGRYAPGKTLSGEFPVIAGNGRIKSRDTLARWSESLGIDWMVRRELAQAIPPAYSEFLGRQLITQLRVAA